MIIPRHFNAFKRLGGLDFHEIYSQNKQDYFFDDFDIGKISASEFRKTLCSKLGIQLSDKVFDSAWNEMLLDLPKLHLDFIKHLKNQYRLFLFSNTNEIHLQEVFNICKKQHAIPNFDNYFEKTYYSNIFGHRKPNKYAFELILADNNLCANETLFVDDSLQHIIGAKKAGLHTLHQTKGISIFDINTYIEEQAFIAL